jgi:hypothetical protein
MDKTKFTLGKFSFPVFFLQPTVYSAFFLTVAIGNCMVKLIPPVNFCSDENIQTIFGTKLEDFLNFFIYYPISMNKKTKDMVFHALQSSHKNNFFLTLFSVANDSQLFFFLMDTCSFLGSVW